MQCAVFCQHLQWRGGKKEKEKATTTTLTCYMHKLELNIKVYKVVDKQS